PALRPSRRLQRPRRARFPRCPKRRWGWRPGRPRRAFPRHRRRGPCPRVAQRGLRRRTRPRAGPRRRAHRRAVRSLVASMASLLIRTTLAVAATTFAAQSLAHADDDADSARAAFVEGTSLVKNAQWAEALGAFERADKLKPHPVTTYNIAQCERAMGRYTRARIGFQRALVDNEAAQGKLLSDSLVSEAKGYLAEIDRLLSRAIITIAPEGAAITVDGRPLDAAPASLGASDGKPLLVAGTRAPGPGDAAPRGRFIVVVDPGAHVFTFIRKGYSDAVVNRTFGPGSTLELNLALD